MTEPWGSYQLYPALSESDKACECMVCNPLVKAREKIDLTCPTTGLGFIGPQRMEDL